MDTGIFFKKIRTYHDISAESERAWTELFHLKTYHKGEHLVSIGQHPKRVYFVVDGLLSQNYITEDGDTVIKYFFPEYRMAASLAAMLSKTPSLFDIVAIEKTIVIEYDFFMFRQLVETHQDIAMFYIKYNELHWIIEKEPLEISMRTDTANKRYDDLLRKYPQLVKRLKKHHIASYLGITPTQLSRIFFANK